jgi:S-formylglutathione hydrolase
MRRLTIIAATIAVTVSAFAQEGTVRTLTIHTKALAGNLLGDPVDQQYAVYLPAGYESGNARYPTIYLLHGIADEFEVWINHFKVPQILDRAIASRQMPPTIVVMPNGRNRFLGSYYLNSPVTGHWSDFIADEIVGAVDAQFRTIPAAASRAVVGHSMGGFGAIHFAMTRPDVFSVAYAMSPCCLDAIEDVDAGNYSAWMTTLNFKSYDDIGAALQQHNFYPVALMALLSATSPDPSQPMKVAFPYRAVEGELVRAHPVYDRWLEQFPVHAVTASRDNLSRMRLLAMDFGYDDQFAHIPPSVMELSRALYENRIPFRFDVYNGDHRDKVGQRLERIVFPTVAAALAR